MGNGGDCHIRFPDLPGLPAKAGDHRAAQLVDFLQDEGSNKGIELDTYP